jgi:hypothetical protein
MIRDILGIFTAIRRKSQYRCTWAWEVYQMVSEVKMYDVQYEYGCVCVFASILRLWRVGHGLWTWFWVYKTYGGALVHVENNVFFLKKTDLRGFQNLTRFGIHIFFCTFFEPHVEQNKTL